MLKPGHWLADRNGVEARLAATKAAIANFGTVDPVGGQSTFNPGSLIPPAPRVEVDTLDEVEDRNAAAKATLAQAEAVKKLIDDLIFEKSLIGKSEAEQRALTAARQAGADATDAQRLQIQSLVASIEAEKAALDAVNERMEFAKGLTKDFVGGIVSDLRSGVSAVESLRNAFGRLGDKLIDLALDQAINALFANLAGSLFGGGGLGSSFFSPGSFSIGGIPLYATGTAFHPGGAAIVGEQGPELVMMPRGASVMSAGRTADYMRPSLPAAMGSIPTANDNVEGGITIAPVYQIDARGSSMTPAQIKGLLESNNRQLRRDLPGMLADARRRGEV